MVRIARHVGHSRDQGADATTPDRLYLMPSDWLGDRIEDRLDAILMFHSDQWDYDAREEEWVKR